MTGQGRGGPYFRFLKAWGLLTFLLLIRLVLRPTVHSSLLPFDPQFRPFTAKHLTTRLVHAILLRDFRSASSPPPLLFRWHAPYSSRANPRDFSFPIPASSPP